MNFEEYLTSKRIDAQAFKLGDADLYLLLEKDFMQMHPNSFTVQKLNLINPIRRKYQLKVEAPPVAEKPSVENNKPAPANPVARPMMKPKPKIN